MEIGTGVWLCTCTVCGDADFIEPGTKCECKGCNGVYESVEIEAADR